MSMKPGLEKSGPEAAAVAAIVEVAAAVATVEIEAVADIAVAVKRRFNLPRRYTRGHRTTR